MQAVVNDNLPSFAGDGPDEASGNAAEWARPCAEEALSAAGPQEVLPERVKATTHSDPSDVAQFSSKSLCESRVFLRLQDNNWWQCVREDNIIVFEERST